MAAGLSISEQPPRVGAPPGPWSTFRGNLQRTGNTDNLPGPAKPAVLWVLKEQENFIAAPVPFDDRLFVAGLGTFNIARVHALAVETKAEQRIVWTKTTPSLKLPVVSSPAAIDKQIIFGDGMHQTDGGVLHCLNADDGLSLWQLSVPGRLVHLEGSPTVQGERVYIGGGAAGVLCVQRNRVMLNGKERALPDVRKILVRQWRDMQQQAEADRKKDPQFAPPADEDKLPKPMPIKQWQQGGGQWHVDAPVAVAGERVLVASAYLDTEKVGIRAALCLDASTGTVMWRTPLKLNPWGGPSVHDDVVVIGGSNIRYDPGAIKHAKGEVVALDLATGKLQWQRDVDGGVLSSVALAGGLAVATATDGKVYAFDLATGATRWTYDARTPFFAPPAIAGRTVYTADLKCVVHAVSLDNGKGQWTLELGRDPKVGVPGTVYGGPVVHNHRIFVATCQLQRDAADRPGIVVCLGDN